MTATRPTSTVISVSIHAAIAALLLWTSTAARQIRPTTHPLNAVTLIAPFLPKPSVSADRIGGGGGSQDKTPASEGRLPQIAARQFVPPALQILNPHPRLAMEMSIEAPPELATLDRDLPQLGNPLSHIAGLSGGTGGPLGIGDGHGTGVGDQRGPAAGDGDRQHGGVYSPGHGVTNPVIIHKVEPEFSEEARKAHYSASVLIRADVDATGHPRNIRIVRSAGMGLDDKAIEAVSKWVFKPGTKDGRPVAVAATIEVGFRLL